MNKIIVAGIAACWTVTGWAQEPKLYAQIPNTDRSISYHLHDIPSIHVGVRYVTVLALPEGEKIAGVYVGDRENWMVEHDVSIVTIKAGGVGVRTNLNVVADSGNSYNFLLEEVSKQAGEQIDISVRLLNADVVMVKAAKAKPQFVSYDELEKAKQQADDAQIALTKEQQNRQLAAKKDEQVAQQKVESTIRHNFVWQGNKQAKDFGLKAIYTLNGFTYFEAHPEEAFAIYEKKDGKDSLIEYQLNPDGVYVVPKEINDGYLRVGKSRIEFHKERS